MAAIGSARAGGAACADTQGRGCPQRTRSVTAERHRARPGPAGRPFCQLLGFFFSVSLFFLSLVCFANALLGCDRVGSGWRDAGCALDSYRFLKVVR